MESLNLTTLLIFTTNWLLKSTKLLFFATLYYFLKTPPFLISSGESKITKLKMASFWLKTIRLQNISTLILRQSLIHLIYLVGHQKLMSVMIRFRESYTIFQTTLVFSTSRKKFNLTKDFLSSMSLRLL